jgi:ABC-type amino acid transport substrate-binding protein
MMRSFFYGLLLALLVSGAANARTTSGPVLAATPQSITVVMDDNYPPFIFRDSAGNMQGVLKDTWELWSQRTGIAVTIRAMDWADAQQTMRDGGADVIDTIFKTDARQLIYEFTPPYAKLDVPIFFHKSITGIVDVASLRGFAVGVKDGDACLEFLRSHRLDNFRLYNSYPNLISGAASGDVRVFCMDAPPAVYLMHRRGIEKEFMQTEPIYSGEFHRAVAKGNTAMLKTIQTGMAQITEAEQQAIHEKWHGK